MQSRPDPGQTGPVADPAAQRALADRTRFTLSADALAEWKALNARPARNLPGLRELMARPSPFTGERRRPSAPD